MLIPVRNPKLYAFSSVILLFILCLWFFIALRDHPRQNESAFNIGRGYVQLDGDCEMTYMWQQMRFMVGWKRDNTFTKVIFRMLASGIKMRNTRCSCTVKHSTLLTSCEHSGISNILQIWALERRPIWMAFQ